MSAPSTPVRSDLVFLRRRIKPRPTTPVETPRPASAGIDLTRPERRSDPQPTSRPIDLTRPGRPATSPVPAPAPAPAPASTSTRSSGLDLGRPAPTAPPSAGLDLGRPAPAASGGTGLDLGRPAPAASGGTGLDLGAPSGTPPRASEPAATGRAPSRPQRPAELEPFPAPSIDDVRELGVEDPVLRLDARQSAIGSLIVFGCGAAFWESDDLVTGTETSAGERHGTSVMTSGNRPLVGFDDGDGIIALRHVRSLRRALFLGNGNDQLGLQLFDGSSVVVERGDADRMVALSVLEVDGLLELRAEPLAPTMTLDDLLREFGFVLTADLPVRDHRRR